MAQYCVGHAGLEPAPSQSFFVFVLFLFCYCSNIPFTWIFFCQNPGKQHQKIFRRVCRIFFCFAFFYFFFCFFLSFCFVFVLLFSFFFRGIAPINSSTGKHIIKCGKKCTSFPEFPIEFPNFFDRVSFFFRSSFRIFRVVSPNFPIEFLNFPIELL
jgi:hypothetical protein